MAYTEQNFVVYKGEGRSIRITVLDEHEVPLDLSGFTDIKWRLAKSLRDATPLVTKTLADGIVADTDKGVVMVYLDPADIPTKPGAYIHELRIEEDADTISTVMTGVMTVRDSLFGGA